MERNRNEHVGESQRTFLQSVLQDISEWDREMRDKTVLVRVEGVGEERFLVVGSDKDAIERWFPFVTTSKANLSSGGNVPEADRTVLLGSKHDLVFADATYPGAFGTATQATERKEGIENLFLDPLEKRGKCFVI